MGERHRRGRCATAVILAWIRGRRGFHSPRSPLCPAFSEGTGDGLRGHSCWRNPAADLMTRKAFLELGLPRHRWRQKDTLRGTGRGYLE